MILYMSFRKTSVYSEQSLSKSQRKYKKIEMIIEKIYPLEIVRLTKNTMNRVHYMRKKNACLRGIQRSHTRVDHRLRTSESGTSHYNVYLLFSFRNGILAHGLPRPLPRAAAGPE